MKSTSYLQSSILGAALALAAPSLSAQHVHLTAGAPDTLPGTPLQFLNADTYLASSGFVFNMALRTNGPTAGLYEGGPTFTAASADGLDGPPAASGSQLALVVSALAGPDGGVWSFWESPDCELAATNVTFSVPVGATNISHRFLLSQNTGLPGEDPFGHCHGRKFTANKPGVYTLQVRLIDVSRNGPGGGPLHAPSALYQIHFQAGFTISSLTHTNLVPCVTFATSSSFIYFVEAKSVFDEATPWTSVGAVRGNNRWKTVLDINGSAQLRRYYRLRVTTP